MIKDRKEFMRLIDAVDDVLNEVEEHLKSNEGTNNYFNKLRTFSIFKLID